jgi:predicted aconitase
MYLTKDEQAILDGEQGAGAQKAMELVTALGKIYGADSLVDITSAHLPVHPTRPSARAD